MFQTVLYAALFEIVFFVTIDIFFNWQVADFMMKENLFPSGVIIANEIDPKRCDRLATNLIK